MKPKTLLLMSVALICGLGASYLTSRLLADRHPDDTEKVRILVAKRQLNMGDPIKVPQEMFEEREYIKDQEPREALVKFEEIKGRVLKKGLRQGDFVRIDDLIDVKDAGLGGNLPQGYRAVGQRVTLEGSVSGFASLPHSRVDIVQTVRRGDDASSYSKIILENVLVLAADGNPNRPETGGAMPAGIVTFALSPEDGLKLNLAREVGSISLMLRKFGENGQAPVNIVKGSELKNGPPGNSASLDNDAFTDSAAPSLPQLPPLKAAEAKPAEMKPEAAVPSPQEIHNLTIIQGTNAWEVNYIKNERGRFVNQNGNRPETPVRPPQVQAAE